MKGYVLLLVFAVASADFIDFDSELDEDWENFKITYGKHYNESEEVGRRIIWEKNMAEIVRHNLLADMGQYKYTKGINKFSDLSHSEFVKMFNGFRSNGHRNGSTWVEPRDVQLPDKLDWRDYRLVTPVKDQGQCGSCWAFSATGSLEGQHMQKTGQLISLSEQQLVDCSSAYGNNGCQGGLKERAFLYIMANRGIDTEQSYPYTAKDGGSCLFNRRSVGATCSGYIDVPSRDEDALRTAVATVGPISVSIDADQPSFQHYKSGIYDEPYCRNQFHNLDHDVLIVGYGAEKGTDFWIVKNSWGTSWGELGYIKMSRNKGNQCGIATEPSYPLV